MKVEFLAPAEHEFRQGIRYYAAFAPALGHEFALEVERVCSLIGEHNALGPRCDGRHRRLPLRRFPYTIIYRVDGAVVRIVAVAHKRRGPKYWAATYVRDVVGIYTVELAA